jgi:hypothetical protein
MGTEGFLEALRQGKLQMLHKPNIVIFLFERDVVNQGRSFLL